MRSLPARSIASNLIFLVGFCLIPAAHAETYWLDSRFDVNQTHYAVAEEACITGELQRRLDGYIATSTLPHRYTSAYVGPDNGLKERVCRGQIQRRQAGLWLPVELVDTLVYGPLGSRPTCNLPGLADPDTGQCGVPKCDDDCQVAGDNGSNPIDSATGNKRQREVDYTGAGVFPLHFERYYNSHRTADNQTLPLGAGWTHSYSARIVPLLNASGVIDRVRVKRPNGAIQTFTFNGTSWVGDADVPERVSVTLSGGDLSSATYNRRDDTVEAFDSFGRLISITRKDGARQTLSYSTGSGVSPYVQRVADSQGRSLAFSYTTGQLISVLDDTGHGVTFTYASGNLATAAYPHASGTAQRTYHYNESGQTGGVSQPRVLTGITDESSSRYASWSYDSSRRGTLSVHGPFAGGTIDRVNLVYNSNGTSQITDSLGQTRSFTFDVKQRVARLATLDAPCTYCGTTKARTYDVDGSLATSTDFRNGVATYDYDSRLLPRQTVEASNDVSGSKRTVQTDWHASFRVPTERRTYDSTGALVAKQTWTYNTRGQPLTAARIDPATGVTRTTTTSYCEQPNIDAGTCPLLGLVTAIDGPRADVSDVVTYTYYASDEPSCASSPSTCPYRKGDLWKAADALAHVTETLKYDGAGRVLSMKDVNGVITDLEYHPRGWLSSRKIRGTYDSTETDDQITRIDYFPTGLVQKVTLPDGSFTTYEYDAAHRLTDVTDRRSIIHYTLDDAGNRTKEDTLSFRGDVLRTLSRVYNQLGQLQIQKDAYDHATGYSYDANGNTDTVTDALNRVTDHDYDPLNRLSKTIQNLGGINATTQFRYDTQANLTTVIDPKSLTTGYTYNGLGDLTQQTSPDTGTTTYAYDSGGNRQTQVNARNITVSYSYDALNRLTSVTYPTANLNVTYTYDVASTDCPVSERFAIGRLARMQNGSSDTQYCFDRFGNVTRKLQISSGRTLTLLYGYTKTGHLSSVTYPDGSIADYARDSHGRITEVGVARSGSPRQVLLTAATYYPFGPAAEWAFGNGRALQRSLNQNYQPGFIEDLGAGGLSLGYEFDAVGNLLKLRNADQGEPSLRRYGYDALNRLTETRDGATDALLEGYGYDATGNRRNATDNGTTTAYTYAPTKHRLYRVGGVSRTIDGAGNLRSIGGTAQQFTFDSDERMSDARRSGTVVMAYRYNPKGEQIYRYLGTNSVYTIHDEAGHWLGEYDNAGVPLQQVVWLDDLPVGLILGPVAANRPLHYIEADTLGTPRTIIDAQRNVAVWTWPLTGEAFGKDAPIEDVDGDGTALVFNLRFPGQRYDAASGLNYNYFRDYEPTTGRYIESDPIGLLGGVATYAYVRGNPISLIDPSGLADRYIFNGATLTGFNRYGVVPVDSYLRGSDLPAYRSVNSVPSVSGPWGSGKLPTGTYGGRNLRSRSNEAMTCPDGNGWSLDLDDKDGRSLLRIHPDGNESGTEGCVGVVCGYHNEAFNDLQDGLLRNGGEIILEVDYGP